MIENLQDQLYQLENKQAKGSKFGANIRQEVEGEKCFETFIKALSSWDRGKIGIKRKILNPICNVVVPCSSDFEGLAVVFSTHVLRENRKHVYLSGKYEAISQKKFIQVIQIEKLAAANFIIIRIRNKCRFCNTKIILQ